MIVKKMKLTKKNKVFPIVLTTLFTLSILTACNSEASPLTTTQTISGTAAAGDTASGDTTTAAAISAPVAVEYSAEDEDSTWDRTTARGITLSGSSITSDSKGATVDASTITITSAGTYVISGTLTDGQVVIDAADQAVRLVLNGADITCSTGAPIYIMNANKTVIILADGTENKITDGTSYSLTDTETDEPNAAIFSKSDLTMNGTGSLSVIANYKHGINCKDELVITGGNITVDAAGDGIRGKDSIAVKNADITILAGSDGMQSSNEEDAQRGFVAIENSTLSITSGNDGIQAQTSVLLSSGDIAITTGGASSASDSMKAIKAEGIVTINGGTFAIDSEDDAIHSNSTVQINGGVFIIASGDDGIHADAVLEINGGEISISDSFEGIESAQITVNDGKIMIRASDDGINVAGGADGSSVNGRPGQNTFASTGTNFLNINGGYISVNAAGDGIDVAGSITMTSGVVLVSGPTDNGNGALDCDGTFEVNGGYLVAAGSSGMAAAPGTTSAQNAVMINLTAAQPAGTIIHIESEDGEDILTYAPVKEYSSVVLCSPDLISGMTYKVFVGGSSTGTVTDDLYSGGTYTAGTESTGFTVSGTVTTVGTASGGMGGGKGGMAPGGGRG